VTGRRVVATTAILAVVIGLLTAVSSSAAPGSKAAGRIHNIKKSRVVSFPKATPGTNQGARDNSKAWRVVNRSLSRRPNVKQGLAGVPRVRPNLALRKGVNGTQLVTFEGLNHFDQRNANGGNQFSTEPPDQGLCVGGGFVIEVVNQVIQVYDVAGLPLSGVVDLNTFYGYPPAFVRPGGPFGPVVFDPSCYYDPEHGDFIVVAATLETDPSDGSFTGASHLDVAVGAGADPLGTWNVYSIPTENDGSNGTPDHNCTGGPCFPDFPHIGADAHGFFITTNEYDFFGPNYQTAQIYAMSKAKLAAGVGILPVVHMDNLFLSGQPGFTVWPAQSNKGRYAKVNNGTEYFLSSRAAAETGNQTGMASTIGIWRVFNTRSLNGSKPRLFLGKRVLRSAAYAIPPLANQKPDPNHVPLADCMANPPCFGIPADQIASSEEGPLDSSDTRMFQVWYAAGRLWSALDTIVAVPSPDPPFYLYEAAVLWFVVNPDVPRVTKNGYWVAEPNGSNPNNLIYPSVAILPGAKGGIISANLVGYDSFPSQIWANMTPTGPGAASLPNAGIGPQDGFTEYLEFTEGHARPRWGDYSAAVTDGTSVWMAHEVINQICDDTEFNADPTCGGTRTALANWSTQISRVVP
jgi:hypothetical protein